jgi:hypothetical protein
MTLEVLLIDGNPNVSFPPILTFAPLKLEIIGDIKTDSSRS